jgi:hypothetical protein
MLSRTVLACCTALALVLGIKAAHGQDSIYSKDLPHCLGFPPCHLGIVPQPIPIVVIPIKPQPIPTEHAAPIKTVILYDIGGVLSEHAQHWQTIAAAGGPVEVRGICMSACTLVTIYIPRDRLCFGERAALYFHMARYANGQPALKGTEWMINNYPDNIRGWLDARGGLEKITVQSFWKLPASELWKMGYSMCLG